MNSSYNYKVRLVDKYPAPLSNDQSQYLAEEEDKMLKKGIWLYFILLIFEGALRKWFLPGLATPLLIVRDPLALWLLLKIWQQGLLPSNFYLKTMILVGIVGSYTALLFGHGNFMVTIFGARILLIHFPLIFAIGQIFNREDVIKIGKVILMISIPMAILIILQFFSPQSAWVNRGVGGDLEGAGFDGAMGYSRPPGTFSFTNGTALFYGLVVCFILYFWLVPKGINRLLLIASTASLFFVVPLSISRALFFSVCVSLTFAIFAISHNPKFVGRLFMAGIGGFILLAILSQASYFQTAVEVFFSRFDGANESGGGLEGVLIDRYLGGMWGALTRSSDLPFFGYGLGMGTNVGSKLLTGEVQYLISEGEWGRLVGELGPLLGITVIMVRLSLCFKVATASFVKLQQGDLLPWMLLSFFLLTVPQGQWAQPTSLGFSTLIGGLIIASFRHSEEN